MMRMNYRESIAFRFSAFAFIISLSLGIIRSFMVISVTFDENKKLAQKSIQQITDSHIPFLISSLWLTHTKLLQDQVDAIERFKYIAGVEVIDTDNHRYSAGVVDGDYRLIQKELLYRFRGKRAPVGTLHLYIDDEQIREDTFSREIDTLGAIEKDRQLY